jgi:hypothetical protein
MNETAQFVSDLNVARFLEKLRSERDPSVRASLRRLLVEEGDKFGRSAECLRNVQQYTAEGRHQIEMQKAVIAKLKADGQDVRPAERALSNLVEIQRIFEEYRQVVLNSIDRNRA